MNKIVYIIPYFGKLPDSFASWLISAGYNEDVDFLIFTDDKTEYIYPQNIKIIYTTFNQIKEKIQSLFPFTISLERPWKLCDYKVTYGIVFQDYIKDYLFWGYCDLDLIWGKIKKFITNEMLENYDKIGFQGHSTLIRNNIENNCLFKKEYDDLPSYKTVFSSSKGFCFDEWTITKIFERNGKKVYKDINFCHLKKYNYNFVVEYQNKKEEYKNKKQIFEWKQGNLYRIYLYKNKIFKEEILYLHFWCRPISYKIKKDREYINFIIYPDCLKENNRIISKSTVFIKGRKKPFQFYIKAFIKNRKKITIKSIIFNLKAKMKG